MAPIPGVAEAYPSKTMLPAYRGRIAPILAISEQGYQRYGADPTVSRHDREINAAVVGGGKMLVSASASGRFGLHEGDHVTFDTPAGPRTFAVVGVYEDPSAVLPTFYVTYEDATAAWGLGVADVIDVFVQPGVASSSVAAAIRNQLGPRYGLSPDTRRQFIDRLSAIVSSLQLLSDLAALGLGSAAAVGAAISPARRAALLDVTDALQYE